MGKTSPYTGTTKKAIKAEGKARKFLAEEGVKEKKALKPYKKESMETLSKIGKGKYSPPTDIKTITKEIESINKLADKSAQQEYAKRESKAISDYQRYTTPTLGEMYSARGSAAKQALKESGEDLARSLSADYSNTRNSIAGQYLNQLSQNRNQDVNARLQASGGLMNQPIQPVFGGHQSSYNPKTPSQGQDWGSAIGGVAEGGGKAYAAYKMAEMAAAAMAGSSREIKENIKDYEKGLDVVDKLNVVNYDYTVPMPGRQSNRVGLIAEEVPEEIQGMLGEIKAVDVYGLVGILVNAVKQLHSKVKVLEGQVKHA